MAEHRLTGDTHTFTLDDGSTIEVRRPSYDSYGRLWAEVVGMVDGAAVNRARIDVLDQRHRIDYHAVAAARDGRVDWNGALIDIVPKLQAALGQTDEAPEGLALTSLGDLLDEPDDAVDWLVDARLPAGGFGMLAGKPKAGKSTLARCLALAIARGESFLGCSTAQGAVIYLALEEKRSEVRKHFRDMGATGEEEIYIFAATAPADALARIRVVAEDKRPALIIIDPLFRLTRVKDGNDYAQVTTALEPLLVLARQTGAHVLCVHHLGKGDRQGGDAILGSTAIFAAVDTAMILKRTDRYRTLSSVQRYGQDMEESILCHDDKTRLITLGETKEREEILSMKDAIAEWLKSQSEPRTEADLKSEVEGNNRHKQTALRELVKEDMVTRGGRGGKGDPYKYSLAHLSYIPKSVSEHLEFDVNPGTDGAYAHFRTSEIESKSGSEKSEHSGLVVIVGKKICAGCRASFTPGQDGATGTMCRECAAEADRGNQ